MVRVKSATIGLGTNFPSIYSEAFASKSVKRIGMQLGNQGGDKLSPTSGHVEKPPRKPGKRWKKGSMKGKGGPQNAACEYRGVRQRTWGKWVAEIREPKKRARLWLGSFATAKEAALAYDIAACKLYGPLAELNLPAHESAGLDSVPTSQSPDSTKPGSPTRTMHRDVEDTEQLTSQAAHARHGAATSPNVDISNHSRFAVAELATTEAGATSSSSSQVPQRVFSLPEWHQLQYYCAEGHAKSSSGDHLKDIQAFLEQFDSDYPTPFVSVDDDNESTSSLSPSMDSVGASFHPTNCPWQDQTLGSQFLSLDLDRSVSTDPLVPENLDLWDTRDDPMPPASNPPSWIP